MIKIMAPETHTISDRFASWLEIDTHPTPLVLAEAIAERANWRSDPRRNDLVHVHPTSPVTISALCHIAIGLDEAIAEYRVSIDHRTQQITGDAISWSKLTHSFEFLADWDRVTDQRIEAGRLGSSLGQVCYHLLERTTKNLLHQLLYDHLLERIR